MGLNDYRKQFISEMISINSVGGDPIPGAPYGEGPRKALSVFLDKAASEGFATGVLDDRVGWCEIGSGDRMMGIVCHLDVVPAGEGWTTDPFEAVYKDGNIYGRGIVDDKGPAMASFFAMKDIKDSAEDPGIRIRLILGTDEERTCSCVEYYDRNGELPDFSITPDAEFPVIYAEKGILHLEVTDSRPAPAGFTASGGDAANMVPPSAYLIKNGEKITASGKMAHASKPDLGINAIEILASKASSLSVPILDFIRTFDASLICGITDHSGSLTSNIGILRIDESQQNAVIDIRYPVTASHEDILAAVRKQACEYGLNVSIANHMAPICMDKDSSSLLALTSVWESHMDRFDGFCEEYRTSYSAPLAIGGGTYARHMRNTVAFGIQTPWAEDQCHQANEHISENDFIECISIIRDAILKISKNLR